MRKPLIIMCSLFTFATHAQSVKNKTISIAMPSYAKKLAPKEFKTYAGAFALTNGAALPFSEEEFKRYFRLQSFTLSESETAEPDLLFTLNGVKSKDLDLKITRNKSSESYVVEILPKTSATIKVLLMANGEPTHFSEYGVKPRGDVQGNAIAETFDFSFDEADKYLIFEDESSAKATPYLIEQYLVKALGGDYLVNKLLPTIYENYDIRTNLENEKFYYLKDKKVDALKEETEGKIVELEKVSEQLNTIDGLRAGKDQLNAFSDYWLELLSKYDLESKDGSKIGWGIYMNLVKVSMAMEDFTKAREYMDKAIALKEKKWITSSLDSSLKRKVVSYNENYDASTGERLYVDAFVKDEMLQSIADDNAIKANNIQKVEGYVVKEDGTKVEGLITMRFSQLEKEGGNIADISSNTTAKRVTVRYVNQKGKTKNMTLKCKDVSEIVVGDKVFEPVNPKKGLLDHEAVGFGMLNTVVFMQRLYSSDKIKLFQDLTGNDEYYFEIPNVKKAEEASAEYFASCSALSKRIEAEEFENTKEDQIKIAEAYTSSCN